MEQLASFMVFFLFFFFSEKMASDIRNLHENNLKFLNYCFDSAQPQDNSWGFLATGIRIMKRT